MGNHQSYPIVDVVDDGIDNGSATPVHADFYELGSTSNPDRLIYNANCTTDAAPNAVGGHGNLNLGIVGGYNDSAGYPNEDASGYNYGLGISPYTRLAGTKIFTNAGSFDLSNCSGTINGLVLASYNNGASFTSNSWGASVGGAYNVDSQAYDARTRDAAPAVAGNQEMLHIFAAGNNGSGVNTIGAPGTAKNVLTVGATENVRDEGVLDGCNYGGANSADDIATFSSRGPTDDNRVKPDVMAPGTHVQGPASQDPGFDGSGVCGAAGGNKYYPTSPAQTLYTWSSGTSHSTPAVAGAASLVWEYYGHVWTSGATPSPAMLKGLLLNTPRYLNGSGTGGTLPSNNQGWGDVNLGMLFDSSDRILQDQTTTFANTGEVSEVFAAVSNTALPFNVTLVWSDPAGPTTGNSYINNLDLEVIVGSVTYKGNVFSGANSVSGGTADVRNNVENVFLPAGTSGTVTIRVIATNIAGDGVPGNADTTDQDFALIVYNGSSDPTFTLDATPASLNVCAPADGSINVDVASVYGFVNPVTLSVSGNPAGSSAAFSVNPVTPTGSSVLTIGSTGAATAGAYTLQIDGVSGAINRSDTVALNLFSAAPSAPSLTSPASGSKGVSPNTSFSWSAVPNTQSYAIEIATDAAFSNIVASASGLLVTTYTPGAALSANTLYFWRVRAENTCGSGSYAIGAFVTANLSSLSSCSNPALAIPDNNPAGVSNDMVIASSGTIVDLDVSVQATHTWIGDLIFTVQNTNTSTSVTVIDRPGVPLSPYGCDNNHVNATLSDEAGSPVESQCAASTAATPPPYAIDGTFSPNNSLSAFDGQAFAATWRITASDNVGTDTGTLTQLCLNATVSSTPSATTYADPLDATCGGNSPCYSGAGAIQSALNAVSDGGVVVVTGDHILSSPLTCVGGATLQSSNAASLTWSGGAGSMLSAFDCNLTVRGLTLNGGNTATIFEQVGSGTVTAYANNIQDFAAADSGPNSVQIGHNYWGTGDPNAAAPGGMPAGQWEQRLGAPVGAYAEGSGSATLGSATLTGGSGTAVIVSMGRAATPIEAPFGNGVAGHVENACSDFYDFFVLGGSGSWSVSLPVDNLPACNANTLNANRLYWITDIAECSPASNPACWDLIAGAAPSGQNLVVSGLTSAQLGGTHFVAGDQTGTDPNAIRLNRAEAQNTSAQMVWVFAVAVLMSALLGLAVWRRVKQ